MRTAAAVVFLTGLTALAWSASGGAQDNAAHSESYDAEKLRLIRVVGLLDIQTGGDRITVDYEPGSASIQAPEFDVDGDTLEITQLGRRDEVNCRSRDDRLQVEIENDGYNPLEDYGTWRIRIPAGASVEVGGGSLSGSIGDVGELSLGMSSCGDITVGDVAGDADLAMNGSGDIIVGNVGEKLSVAINGSGDIKVGTVGGEISAAINGSGDIEVASLNGGDLNAAINGSGDVRVLGGEASNISAAVMGSGDVSFAGVAQRVNLSAFGSGDVYVTDVSGPVRSSAFGSGRVHVGEF